MSNEYYSNRRLDVQAILYRNISKFSQESLFRILEIGCASGRLGADIKVKYSKVHYTGVDFNLDALDSARMKLDRVYHFDFNSDSLDNFRSLVGQDYDFIICADVLEHLIDPLELVFYLHGMLKENGKMIISIPNIMHISIIKELVVNMDFEYKDSGILDKTHLRFYTRKSFLRELNRGGLLKTFYYFQNGTKSKIFAFLFGRRFLNYFSRQIIYVVDK